MSETLIDFFGNKRIALLGFGREGQSSYAFLRKIFPNHLLTIADRKEIFLQDPLVTLYCGKNYLDSLRHCDIVIKSPGISLKDITVPEKVIITCQTDLFLRFEKGFNIGITGSKGKTTTSTLLHAMLCEFGYSAQLIGNIGCPVLDNFHKNGNQISVIELSSHQLEYTRFSPEIAILTNLFEEHLDHYTGGFSGYSLAKSNILKHQSEEDLCILTKEQNLTSLIDLSDCRGTRRFVGAVPETPFFRSLISLNPHLRGVHNHQNIFFAATAARALGVTDDAITRSIEKFPGIPNRMQQVSKKNDIFWVNDSISTIPHAVLCTIDALENVDTLLVGGLDRGLNYEDFARSLLDRPVKNFICLPKTGHLIADILEEIPNNVNIFRITTMEEAVQLAATHTKKQHTCLLSPAAASYNVYKDFEEKGEHFVQCIQDL